MLRRGSVLSVRRWAMVAEGCCLLVPLSLFLFFSYLSFFDPFRTLALPCTLIPRTLLLSSFSIGSPSTRP